MKALRFLTWAKDSASQAALVRETLRQQGVERFVASRFVHGNCEPATTCVWTDGADPVLPMAEAVAFSRVVEDSGESATVEMLGWAPWAEVQRLMGDRMVSLDIYPGCYSCQGFPSESDLGELRLRGF